MLCYQIGETTNYLQISWKVPLYIHRNNELCIHVDKTQLPNGQKESNIFRKIIHNKHKRFPINSIRSNENDIKASAVITSG